MNRKRVTFYIDARIAATIPAMAKADDISANRWVEKFFMAKAIALGELPGDFEPLGERRGGKRNKAS